MFFREFSRSKLKWSSKCQFSNCNILVWSEFSLYSKCFETLVSIAISIKWIMPWKIKCYKLIKTTKNSAEKKVLEHCASQHARYNGLNYI